MPYDLYLAERIRKIIGDRPELTEKKMFGGVGYMLNGNLACGVQGDELIVRIGPDKDEAAFAQPHVHPFMPTHSKPMAGWVMVAPAGLITDENLRRWVELGIEFALSLPEKR